MSQLQLVQLASRELLPGMYVAELDIPWSASPFLIEGFRIADTDEVVRLQGLCSHVMVDVARSDSQFHEGLSKRMPPSADADAPPDPMVSRSFTASLVSPAAPARPDPRSAGLHADLDQALGKVSGQVPAPLAWRASRRAAARRRPATAAEAAVAAASPAPLADPAAVLPDRPVELWRAVQPAPWDGRERRRWPRARATRPDGGPELIRQAASPLIVASGARVAGSEALLMAHRIHDEARDLLVEFLEDVRQQRKPELAGAQRAVAQMADSISENPDSLVWLTHLKRQDSYAYRHGIDCAVHLLSFGRHLGYPREILLTLGLAGLLLDVGKLRVPEALRSHPGRYSKAEMLEMQRHVLHSIDILHAIPGIDRKVLEIVAQHHERMDGSGYPVGLDGAEIDPLACMAAIVDGYTAMVSERPHAEPRSIHAALQTLDHWKGHRFHPSLVEQFLQCVGIFPVGTLVEMSSGEIGVVVTQNRVRRLMPTVMLLLDPDQQPYPYPPMIDLLQAPIAPGGEAYRIVRDLSPGSYGIDPAALYLTAR